MSVVAAVHGSTKLATKIGERIDNAETLNPHTNVAITITIM